MCRKGQAAAETKNQTTGGVLLHNCCHNMHARHIGHVSFGQQLTHHWMSLAHNGNLSTTVHQTLQTSELLKARCCAGNLCVGPCVQATLGQHETYAKLEAQGAQHVEMEMRKMRLQLKEKQLEVSSTIATHNCGQQCFLYCLT